MQSTTTLVNSTSSLQAKKLVLVSGQYSVSLRAHYTTGYGEAINVAIGDLPCF